jgi:hypothetical protein
MSRPAAVGDDPNSVVYNDGVQDLLVWVLGEHGQEFKIGRGLRCRVGVEIGGTTGFARSPICA